MPFLKSIDHILFGVIDRYVGKQLSVVLKMGKGTSKKKITVKGRIDSLYPHGFLVKSACGNAFVAYVDLYANMTHLEDCGKLRQDVETTLQGLRMDAARTERDLILKDPSPTRPSLFPGYREPAKESA